MVVLLAVVVRDGAWWHSLQRHGGARNRRGRERWSRRRGGMATGGVGRRCGEYKGPGEGPRWPRWRARQRARHRAACRRRGRRQEGGSGLGLWEVSWARG